MPINRFKLTHREREEQKDDDGDDKESRQVRLRKYLIILGSHARRG